MPGNQTLLEANQEDPTPLISAFAAQTMLANSSLVCSKEQQQQLWPGEKIIIYYVISNDRSENFIDWYPIELRQICYLFKLHDALRCPSRVQRKNVIGSIDFLLGLDIICSCHNLFWTGNDIVELPMLGSEYMLNKFEF